MPSKKPAEAAPRATHPPEERGTRGVSPIDADDEARWLALADLALSRGASEVEVAEIVAETMDGYLIHPHRIVCKVVEVDDEKIWEGANKIFKKIPWTKINRERIEGKKTKEKWEDLVVKDKMRSKYRAEKIKAAGIDYDFLSPKGGKRKVEEVKDKAITRSPRPSKKVKKVQK